MPITLPQIDQWISLIKEDELEECLNDLCQKVDEGFKSDKTEIFTLNARINLLNKEKHQGTITKEKHNIERNQIRAALLELLLDHQNKTLKEIQAGRTVTLAEDKDSFLDLLKANLPDGRYTQLECISHGDYCLVYKAIEDEGTDYEQTVAIKVFKNISLIDQENRNELNERFSKSKRYSMKDGIITILNDDLESLPHYYIMPYINGMTLNDYLNHEWPMQLQEIKNLLIRVAQALQRGHRDGLIHMGLRPSNIMIDKHGDWEPQIFPFQVIRFNITQRSVDRIKQIVSYWSPEQINGEAMLLGPKVDQYSLGLVAYELFKLKPFYRGKTVLDALEKRIQYRENPKILREELSETQCPEKMIDVICKLMAEIPGNRYRNMKQVINDINAIPFTYTDTSEDFQLLLDSFNYCRKKPTFYQAFYDQFFEKRAKSKLIFQKRFADQVEKNPEDANKNLWQFQHYMLDLAIDRLLVFHTNPEKVQKRMDKLVENHISKYETLAEDFPVFLDCLRDTLAKEDPDTWKDKKEVLNKIWQEFTHNIIPK